MAANITRVVLDTNILISALVYGGKPQNLLELVTIKQITAVISLALLLELLDALAGKFHFDPERVFQVEEKIKNNFEFVRPNKTFNIVRDEDDNRVLEAAVEGECNFIVTGDKDLLELGKYKKIKIVTPAQFLDSILDAKRFRRK